MWVGWGCWEGSIDIFFLLEVPTRPYSPLFPFVVSFLACAPDPPHCSYTEQWVQFSPILNLRSVEQWPLWINYFSSSSDAPATSGSRHRHSHVTRYITLTVTLARLFILRSSQLIFEEKRDCSQSSPHMET